jgi:phospholipid/cholesterol/gamma-HCH transport system permease protein
MKIVLQNLLIQARSSHLYEILAELVNWIKFSVKTLIDIRPIFRYRGETFKQIYILGNQALPLVIISTMFVSMVLALEWGKKLEPFGAKLMLGRIVSISVIREIGPLVAGLMIAGRTGAKIVSEIGNMVLTQQVDALRAFGIDPIKRLIVPRVFASFVVMIPLVIIADTMGIVAGWLASVLWAGVDSQFFWLSVKGGLLMKDLFIGIFKPPFFGIIIGIISGYLGYTIRGGAEGMGQAATRTVMYTSLGVLIMDFVLTKIVLSFY